MTARVAFLQHSEWDLPGGLGDRAEQLGMEAHAYRADRGPTGLPGPDTFDLLVVMGSSASTEFAAPLWVGPERRLVAGAVEAGVAVLGVCFGGQLLAQVLGGRVSRAPEPEIGWRRLTTDHPDLVPPGPWVSWHQDQFDAPPGSLPVARTAVCLHAYVAGVHTGLQFHPEVDAGIVDHWIADDQATDLLSPGQVDDLRDGFTRFGHDAAAQAELLFDRFVARAGIPI